MNLVDLIELHIKAMLEDSRDNKILLRRNELAQSFGCAPSQINYVIQTRFSVERGYAIESQRGGGGFIRVIQLDMDKFQQILSSLAQLDEGISQRQALDFIHWLREQKMISLREAGLMAVVMDSININLDFSNRDQFRSQMLVAMVEAIIREG